MSRHRLRRPFVLRRLAVAAAGAGAFALAAWAALELAVSMTEPPSLAIPGSRTVADRHGALLRVFPVEHGRVRLPPGAEPAPQPTAGRVEAPQLAGVDPDFLALLLAVEDRRFYRHRGADWLALGRAGWQLVSRGRIVSGGSTLSMQLVRLLERTDTRGAGGKLRQVLAALALERRADKEAILAAYLAAAPYGGNLEGLRAGALAWLGHGPERLRPAEAALLVALPQAPEARRPDRDPAAARRARDRVLARALALGLIDAETAQTARREPVPTHRRPFPRLAPHASERLAQAHPAAARLRLTLDAGLQSRLEALATERARAIDPRVSVAILALEHGSGEVLASVGSAGWLDVERDGFVDMARAPRSPGSTLKPLIYGLAFELGLAHPESLIEDRPTAFGTYVPANFDRGFQGTVTVRQALALSLNVPAVQLLDAVGPARLLGRMRRAGAAPVLGDVSPPGLAVGLGGIGVTLTDLVRIYAAIARGGQAVEPVETLDPAPSRLPAAPARVLEPRAAWYLSSILREVPAPAGTDPSGIAFKTGTAYGYRDAWAVGFDGARTVGVWVGRPDGVPVPGLVGIDAAAPILIDAFARLSPRVPLPSAPAGVSSAATGELPPTLRRARVRDAVPTADPVPGPEIAFPPDGARLPVGLADGGSLALKVRHGVPPFTWLADGAPVAREPFRRSARWTPDGPGYAVLSVVDGRGRGSQVRVYVE